MSSYTITITPDDTTRASTTLRIDVSENAATITELLVRAGAAAGLSPQQLPAVDLDLLLRAVNPEAPVSIPAAVTEDTDASEPSPTRRVRGGRSATGRAGRRAAKQAEPKTAGKRAGAKAGRAAKTAAKAAGGGERAYRRAPSDLVQVFGELGGVTAVARHYQVPRYTAQSWIRRLRNEGQLPTR
jgi:hypothetical protein